jgi:hypothetical protein
MKALRFHRRLVESAERAQRDAISEEYPHERDENKVENAIKDKRCGAQPFSRRLNVEC